MRVKTWKWINCVQLFCYYIQWRGKDCWQVECIRNSSPGCHIKAVKRAQRTADGEVNDGSEFSPDARWGHQTSKVCPRLGNCSLWYHGSSILGRKLRSLCARASESHSDGFNELQLVSRAQSVLSSQSFCFIMNNSSISHVLQNYSP